MKAVEVIVTVFSQGRRRATVCPPRGGDGWAALPRTRCLGRAAARPYPERFLRRPRRGGMTDLNAKCIMQIEGPVLK
jgi:hypothetical protein